MRIRIQNPDKKLRHKCLIEFKICFCNALHFEQKVKIKPKKTSKTLFLAFSLKTRYKIIPPQKKKNGAKKELLDKYFQHFTTEK